MVKILSRQSPLATWPDLLTCPLVLTRRLAHTCWLQDRQGRHRVVVAGVEWDRLPPGAWVMAVRWEHEVRVVGVVGGHVVAVLPIIAVGGRNSILRVDPGTLPQD